MEIDGYTLMSADKVHRAIFGSMSAEGQLAGGVGEDASDNAKLAEYDRLGGLILKGGNKVKTGSFYDFGSKKVRTKPKVVFVFRDLNGEEVEVDDGEEIPMEVKAAQAKAKKAAKTPKGKAKKDDEGEAEDDEEDTEEDA